MDWKTFISELVKTLVWPGLILFLFYIYKRPLSKILFALTNTLRRISSIKYGGLAIATESFAAAIDTKEEKMEVVQKELTKPGITEEDRNRLTEELREALEESSRLRLSLKKLSIHSISSNMDSFSIIPPGRYIRSFLVKLAKGIGPNQIKTLFEDGAIEQLINRANNMIEEDKLSTTSSSLSLRIPRKNLRDAGLLNANSKLTSSGASALYLTALDLLEPL